MWWVVGLFISIVIFITYALCVAAGNTDRQLEYIEVRDLDLHNNEYN